MFIVFCLGSAVIKSVFQLYFNYAYLHSLWEHIAMGGNRCSLMRPYPRDYPQHPLISHHKIQLLVRIHRLGISDQPVMT